MIWFLKSKQSIKHVLYREKSNFVTMFQKCTAISLSPVYNAEGRLVFRTPCVTPNLSDECDRARLFLRPPEEDLERLLFWPPSGDDEGERDLFFEEAEPFPDLELDLSKGINKHSHEVKYHYRDYYNNIIKGTEMGGKYPPTSPEILQYILQLLKKTKTACLTN